jgi:hypothetical protein
MRLLGLPGKYDQKRYPLAKGFLPCRKKGPQEKNAAPLRHGHKAIRYCARVSAALLVLLCKFLQ